MGEDEKVTEMGNEVDEQAKLYDGVAGQVMFIKMLSMVIAGKDSNEEESEKETKKIIGRITDIFTKYNAHFIDPKKKGE